MSADEHELTGFIRSTFRSVWSLELLVLVRSEPDRAWRPEELVAILRASRLIITQGIDSLLAAGLIVVTEDGSARFQPASSSIAALADRAHDCYARTPDAVRRLIVGAASSEVSAFADAFRFRKD